tara:strand:- start:828 stop:1592 length:765 start_codon:yes stop_codon:yes gene_type:complete
VCKKKDWCLIAVNGGAVICPRVEQGSVAYIDGSGWLHRFGDDDAPKPRLRVAPKPLPEHNQVLSELFLKHRKQVTPEKLDALAQGLGISSKSLDQLGVGFSSLRDAYAFPMLRAKNRFLGIRYRTQGGQKFAAKGSKQGLFVPSSFTLAKAIVVCEGPTDTAAMLDLGFNAIGRASCNSGVRLVEEIVQGNPVAILADSDEAGRAGACQLARKITKAVIIEPDGHKDGREWVANGATRGRVLEKIREARDAKRN